VDWLDSNWFNLLQSIGIIGGLCFTALALRTESVSRHTSDFLILTGHHRELWLEIQRQPALGRVLQPEVDLVADPITWAEEEFLNLVFVHFQSGWELARRGSILRLDSLKTDARCFFVLPIPKAVWTKTKVFRDEEFIQFVEDAAGWPHE
jgi:hypothetical protein